VTAVLGGAVNKTAILAPAIEKRWLATLRQGVRGLPVHVETFWSMAVFFEEPWRKASGFAYSKAVFTIPDMLFSNDLPSLYKSIAPEDQG